ncbi:hypothetical protein CS369_21110 [Candidatus Symbiopectobacterium sp. 'North America']|uniref:DUF2057 family protein n=1 Tax=Candidatus Symbiopectobacterium sp. 'North America' TaxID=2794574 RepID=UPI0018CB819C|nr:DUF2057 family protein [Candidatus Symbiopectobacterium sp. 'North America']MBG6246595.1 hypothetical protein [Candidatus Symbiopectobacterium sp. 'North America']
MKLYRVLVLLFFVTSSITSAATTLKLHQDIELLAVDGQKVSSSLLKDADSLELDNGQHQLLFRVVKIISASGGEKRTYSSPLLLAAFNMRNQDVITIQLPVLDTPKARERFDLDAHYQLVDNHNNPISARLDRLELSNNELTHQLKPILAQYNAANKNASVTAFTSPKQSAKTWPENNADNAQDSIDPFLILKYWFRQADKDTQDRFMKWAKEKDK